MPYFASWYYYKRAHVLAPFVMGNILESPYGYCFMSLLCGFVYLSGVKGLSSSMVDMYLWLVQWNCHSQQHKLFLQRAWIPCCCFYIKWLTFHPCSYYDCYYLVHVHSFKQRWQSKLRPHWVFGWCSQIAYYSAIFGTHNTRCNPDCSTRVEGSF